MWRGTAVFLVAVSLSMFAVSCTTFEQARSSSLERECEVEREASACFELGVMYAWGVGVEMDIKRAIYLFDRACESGLTQACKELRYLAKRRAERRARPAVQGRTKACRPISDTARMQCR